MNRMDNNNYFCRRVAVVAAAFAVAACGGSSGDASTTAAADNAAPSGSTARAASDSASASVTLAPQGIAATDQASVAWVARSGQNVSASASAQTSIDQGQPTSHATASVNGVPIDITPGSRMGQTFIPQRDGWISVVEIDIGSCGANPDLAFEIRKGSDIAGLVVATATIVASSIVPSASGDCGPVPASMQVIATQTQNTPLAVRAGEVYSLWPAQSGEGIFLWASSSAYPQGMFWKHSSSGAFASGSAVEVSIRTMTILPGN